MSDELDTQGGGLRVLRRSNFTMVDNASVNDPNISFKAKGLLLWLLSKPDGWRFTSAAIAEVGPDGRESVQSGLRELTKAGYYRTERRQMPDGTFRTGSAVSEVPNPDWTPVEGGADSPETENPAPVNPAPVSPSPLQDCLSNTYPSPSPQAGQAAGAGQREGQGELSPEQQWERWWFTYPRKTGKAAALKAWRTATRKVSPQQLLAALEAHLPAWSAREERFIPHASTWLNNERWEDTPEPPPRREYSPWDAPTPEQIAASHGL